MRVFRLLATFAVLGMARAGASAGEPMLPVTTPPIIYTINYSGRYFREPDYIERFRAAPPDLLHVGKAVPITHHWGPIRLFHGENQYTGGPGHTLSWENIALLSPEQLEARIATIRETLRRAHAIGIREIVPYISYHTLAGDHQTRRGFWNFYDHWDTYRRWAGPRPETDPFEWLVLDRQGKFVGGSCGGYSPDYYAPLHRYRACINHPDWAEWHRRLIRLVAEAGYDGCFVDNAHPDPCFCRHCKRLFRQFLAEHGDVPGVRRLTDGLEAEQLRLDAEDVPAERVRRWRLTRTRDHLGMLRETGREVTPGFTIFPNSGRIDDCLLVGAKCDRLMFESTFSPGILSADEPPETGDILIRVGDSVPTHGPPISHRYELYDPRTFMEMTAVLRLPSRVGALRGYPFLVEVQTVGASLRDGDAAEDFHLLLTGTTTGETVRLDLKPHGPIGGSGSSRKPTQPQVTLKVVWTLAERPKDDAYAVSFGYRYTDDSHPETRRRLRRDRLTRGQVCRSHLAELLFTQHMTARTIYLGYDARKHDNVQELALAEMAAFSGGGGFSGTGAPQAKYRRFFKAHPELLAGWTPTAPAAVLFAQWGPNPLATRRPHQGPTIHNELARSHRPFVGLVDSRLPEDDERLGRFRVLYLESPAYEMSEAQLAALRRYAAGPGRIVLQDKTVAINGTPAAEALGATAETWNADEIITTPVAPTDGRRASLRFALYRKEDRLALHAVNYNVCLLDKGRKILPVPPTPLRIPVPSDWQAARAVCSDPDAEPKTVPCSVSDGLARLTVPQMRLYKVILLERQ
jgi:hypothetical protein